MGCSNCDKPKIMCSGNIIPAPCVEFEVPKELQTYVLGGEPDNPTECTNLDEVLTEIYEKIKDLEEATDFSDWKSECIELSENEPTLKGVITDIGLKICELNEFINGVGGLTNICNILDKNITDCDIDFSCITSDSCDNSVTITTLKSWIEWVTNKICALN